MKFNPSLTSAAPSQRQDGFTLVEMLLVLAILAILAGIVYPRIVQRHTDAQTGAAVVQIKSFDAAMETFELDNGRLPKGHDGLLELVQKPAGAVNWHGPYVDHIPKDPWG